MFLYNIHYDKESNMVTGDKIVIPEGISTSSRIALSTAIDISYEVYIDFNLPKGRKLRSERMELIDGKYYLTISDNISVCAGNADIQLVFIKDNLIEKSLINSQLLFILPSINAVDSMIKAEKTVVDTLIFDNIQQNAKLTEHENYLSNHNSRIEECNALASVDKFKIEIIYDNSSNSANINYGFPNGLRKGDIINVSRLSQYRFLIIDCQFERNLTMLMDLTEKNKLNNFYINSIAGCQELRNDFALIAFEIIVDLLKTKIEVNNIARSINYSVGSDLATDKSAYVSKIYGIL